MFLKTASYPLNKDFKPSSEDMAQLRKEIREHSNKKYQYQITPEMYEILKKARRGGNTHCKIEAMNEKENKEN